MYFQVPQFIEIEDKLFGPLTFKQFIYLLGGGAAVFVLVKLLPGMLGYILGAPFAAFALALAFYKVNDRPFIDMVEAWFTYKMGSKLYIWKRREITENQKKESDPTQAEEQSFVPKISQSKLREMTWSLDVLDKDKEN